MPGRSHSPGEEPHRGRATKQAASRLGDDVYAEIKKKIISGQIGKGERLFETVIAQDFTASRTPVREALMRLHEEGLLERKGRAYSVPEISPKELIDLYLVRQQLELLSISIASEKIDDAGFSRLEQNISSMEIALTRQDKRIFSSIDSEFHMIIAECTGNKVLIDILSGIHEKLMFRNSHESFLVRFPMGNDEHALILNALRRRDVAIARAEMHSHIQGPINFLRQLSPSKVELQKED